MQLTYVFSELGTGLRRNLSMTIAVIVTMFVSLTLVGLGLLLNTQADKAEEFWGDRLQITEGALYPALHRMEQRGWLEAEWGVTDKNREAKFYRLSPAGRRALTTELSTWTRYTEAVGLVLAAPRT